MTSVKVVAGALVIVLILGLVLVCRMGRNDARGLADFVASYEQFDKTMSDDALSDLRVKS